MKRTIRIGTRDSRLSVAQATLVAEAVKRVFPDTGVELVYRKTLGDRILDRPLVAFGGKGAFVAEFEEGLLRGEIDFAVHSAKDLPMKMADGLDILGVLPREDRRDVLVSLAGKQPGEGGTACIGTSSQRRSLQIRELGKTLWPGRRTDLKLLRGNVLTRLDKLDQGLYDGIILASAGLLRLHIQEERKGRYQYRYFSEEEMVPAGGQGIIVIQGRKEGPFCQIAQAVSHRQSMEELKAERLVLNRLNAGCHEPVGVSCFPGPDGLYVIDGIYEKGGVFRKARVREGDLQDKAGGAGSGREERLEKMAFLLAGKLSGEDGG